jgi:hypothetical protein
MKNSIRAFASFATVGLLIQIGFASTQARANDEESTTYFHEMTFVSAQQDCENAGVGIASGEQLTVVASSLGVRFEDTLSGKTVLSLESGKDGEYPTNCKLNDFTFDNFNCFETYRTDIAVLGFSGYIVIGKQEGAKTVARCTLLGALGSS